MEGNPISRVNPKKYPEIRGAGDVVAIVAQPIAGIIDRVAGTSLKTCGGCAKRREMLNEKFPFKG